MGLGNNDDIVDMFGVNKNITKRPKDNVIDVEIIKPQPRKSSFNNFDNTRITTDRGSSWEDDVLNSNKPNFQQNRIGSDDIKINAQNMNSMGSNLKNVSPLLMIGIIAIIAASFTPFKWLFTVGFFIIIFAMFDKLISKEKKEELKLKIKGLFKKK